MPVGCGQDFEWSSSPQPPAIAEKTGKLGGCWLQSTDDCTGICMGNYVLYLEARKQDTHYANDTTRGSRLGTSMDQDSAFSGVTTHFGCTSTLGT